MSSKTLSDSIARLNPVSLIANPVMFIVELTFFVVAAMAVYPQWFIPVASPNERVFYVEVAAILLITVWFSTLSDSIAETQAKNTANSLRKLETESMAKKLVTDQETQQREKIRSNSLNKASAGRHDLTGEGGLDTDRCGSD